MMDEVIYGEIFNANIDICVKEPPVKVSKKLREVCRLIH